MKIIIREKKLIILLMNLRIIDNNVFIFSYEEEITCIHIVSNPISVSFRLFFDDLWKIAKV